nr:MAG TPA: 24-sterol C-methyltransferase [Caudoviricetes sp.]
MAEGKPRCPLCGEELRLSYAFTSDEVEGHKVKWHYYCKCGLWFPLRETPEEALSVTRSWKWPKQEEQADEKRKP